MAYVIGEYAEPPGERRNPQERKSPPLAALLPERDAFRRLSPEQYYQPEYVDREWERLWTKVWLCAGRVSDVAEKGAWFTYAIGRENILVVRGEDDRIRAFYNVCQHRGNILVDGDFGKSRAFTCPYHSWRYDRSGRCAHVTDREQFAPGVLDGSLDLAAIRVETFGGFVYIAMDPDAPPLADYLGEVMDIVSMYPLDRMEVRNEVILDLACNWKTTLDAFSENYHVHCTHSSVLPVTEDKIGQMDFYPNGHNRRVVVVGNASERLPASGELHPIQQAMLEGAGVDLAQFAGGPRDVRAALQKAKRTADGIYGEIYAALSDNQLTDSWAINTFPNMHWSFHAEGVLVLRYAPHPTDPERCTLNAMVLAVPGVAYDLFMPPATEREPSGRPRRVRCRHDDADVEAKVGTVVYEDIRNIQGCQRGMRSRGFGGIRLSEHEQLVMFEHAEIERYMRGEKGLTR